MREKKKIIAALLLGMVIGTTGTWFLYSGVFDTTVISTDVYNQLTGFSKAAVLMDYVDTNYYTDVDEENLVEGMYKGIVESLDDPYSMYMTADEYADWNSSLEGSFYGVGLTMTTNDDGKYVVISVVKDSPSEKEGFETGDIVTEVDGKSFDSLDDMVSEIRGEKGTEVKLTYVRDGKTHTKTLVRDEIKVPSVTSELRDDGIGYIAISTFSSETGDDFVKAVEKLEKKNAKGLIIDLRNNGGGLFKESIKVADELLGKCRIVSTVDKEGKVTVKNSDEAHTDLPYVVLVNGGTASASEIVTAAIQDNDGGKIVGTKTFGKGIVQSTRQLSDGSAIKLTVMEYKSPDGHTIQKKGITPDYKVKLKDGSKKDTQLEKAVELLEKDN